MQHSDTNGTKVRNTKSRNFCLTINNYTLKDYEDICNLKDTMTEWAIQSEVGTNGTPHLQIALCFKNARSFNNIKKLFKTAHIEIAKNKYACLQYCNKKDTCDGKIKDINILDKKNNKLNVCTKPVFNDKMKLYKWQEEILEIIKEEPDNRKIYWYYEDEGNTGKSSICKHICMNNKNALYICGKASDMKYAIIQFVLTHKKSPEIILIDIPRSMDEKYISYSGIESIKNGIIFSTKYESGMCMFDSPHVLIFSNNYPDLSKFSEDRWILKKIQ